MKVLLPIVSSVVFAAYSLAAQAQVPVAAPTTADQRAAAYKGPKVVKDSKALGRKMVQKSKPTDMRVPVPVKPVRVK